MSKPVIKVDGISKRYHLGISKAKSLNFRELLARFPNFFGSREGEGASDTFWALDDVSFEVEQGEVIGLIGDNGSGKSTLLKILSRIVHPTKGSFSIQGEVRSLLEVGTGFHPELTGRENIYLNGAVLGFSQSEMKKKFDSIVAFSEIEQFLDMPVKRYSSGMYVRLGFAVAIHMDPDILIIDEVLAVGDAAFRLKCREKISDLASDGTTILLVSHGMPLVQQLASKCLYLKGGKVVEFDVTENVMKSYQDNIWSVVPKFYDLENKKRPSQSFGRSTKFVSARFLNGQDNVFEAGDPLKVELKVRVVSPIKQLQVRFTLMQFDGIALGTFLSDPVGCSTCSGDLQTFKVEVSLPELVVSRYFFNLSLLGFDDEGQPLEPDRVNRVLYFKLGSSFSPRVNVPFVQGSWGYLRFPGLDVDNTR